MDEFFDGVIVTIIALLVISLVTVLIVITSGWFLVFVAIICAGGFINMFINRDYL